MVWAPTVLPPSPLSPSSRKTLRCNLLVFFASLNTTLHKKKNTIVDMIDFYMIVYILMCVLIGGYAVSTLYYRQQTKAAILTLAGNSCLYLLWSPLVSKRGIERDTGKDWKLAPDCEYVP